MAEQRGGHLARRVRAHHGDRQARRYLPQRAEQLQPGHARHVQVGDQQVPVLGRGQPERGRGIGGVRDLEPPPVGEHVHHEQRRFRVVFHHQDTAAGSVHAPWGHDG